MEQKYNSITLCRDEFGDKLFEKLGELIDILTKANYVLKVYCDEPGLGIYVIQYQYKDPDYTSVRLEWYDEEKEYIGEYTSEEN